MATIICDGTDVDELIDEFGTSITITEVSETPTEDEYGEPVYSETEDTVTAIVEKTHSEEERVKSGLFNAGDIYVYFKTADQSYAVVGNKIAYADSNYKITRVDKEQRGDVTYVAGVRGEVI